MRRVILPSLVLALVVATAAVAQKRPSRAKAKPQAKARTAEPAALKKVRTDMTAVAAQLKKLPIPLSPLPARLPRSTVARLPNQGVITATTGKKQPPAIGSLELRAGDYTMVGTDDAKEFVDFGNYAWIGSDRGRNVIGYQPVHLPHGAVVKELVCRWADNDPATASTFVFALSRRALAGGPSQPMTQMVVVGSVDSSSVQQLNVRTIDHATISNSHAYIASFYWSRGTTTGDDAIRNRFHGCTIHYQKP